MLSLLRYFFYPNPGAASYTTPTQLGLLLLCAALVAASFGIGFWRKGVQNPVTKKLSRSWSSVSFWMGIVGAVLVVARVEQIQFVAMRFLWVLWVAVGLIYVYLQLRLFRAKHYEVLPRERVDDPRNRYLPGKKRR
jgi:hypothetical protein